MKIKYLPIISAVWILCILVTGCQKNSSAPDTGENDPVLTLPGHYASSTALVTIKLTSSSDQQANDLFKDGSGSIEITGAHNTQMKFLTPVDLDDVSIILASDQSPLMTYLAPIYPLHKLTLIDIAGFIKMAAFTAKSSAADSIDYYGRYSSFDYVDSTRTLIADNFNYYTQDSSAFVNFNGSLTAAVIDLPANVETTALTTIVPVMDIGFLTVNDDSTYQIKISYDSIIDSVSGRWYLPSGNRIAFIHDYGDGTPADTVEAGYTRSTGVLNLTLDEDAEEYIDMTGYGDMIPYLEMVLGMESNSLTNINVELSIVLVEKVGKSAGMPSSSLHYEQLLPRNIITNLAEFGKNIKAMVYSAKKQ